MKTSCFVEGCFTGHPLIRKKNKERGTGNRTLYSVPKEAALFDKWEHALPNGVDTLRPGHLVCELHFEEKLIVRANSFKLADGTVHLVDLERPRLESGAVPSIFPVLPDNWSAMDTTKKLDYAMTSCAPIPSRKAIPSAVPAPDPVTGTDTLIQATRTFPRKRPATRELTRKNCQCHADSSGDDCPSCHRVPGPKVARNNAEVAGRLDPTKELAGVVAKRFQNVATFKRPLSNIIETGSGSRKLTFEKLSASVSGMDMPSKMWVTAQWGDTVACVKLDALYVSEKRVIVSRDLSLKIFLGEVQAALHGMTMVSSLEELSGLLTTVDDLQLCEGVELDGFRRPSSCPGYVTEVPGTKPGVGKRRCSSCRDFRLKGKHIINYRNK